MITTYKYKYLPPTNKNYMRKLPKGEKRVLKSHTFDPVLYKSFQAECYKHGKVPSRLFENFMKRQLNAI
jgi:hypothetical protein